MEQIAIKYPIVAEKILLLHRQILSVLGENFVGMYIHGSLSTGDFNMTSSDIDFIVLIREALSIEAFENLKQMHDKFLINEGEWARRFEGSYVIFDWLKNLDRPIIPRPYYNGGILSYETYGFEWILELFILREHGISVVGEPLQAMIPLVESSLLRQATQNLMENSWLPFIEKENSFSSEYQQYAVLTMCRVLYMQAYGQIVSKKVASSWAIHKVDSRFKHLIEAAQNLTGSVEWEQNELTKGFIKYVYEYSYC